MSNPISEPLVDGHEESLDTAFVLVDATPAGIVNVTINRPDRRNAFDDRVVAAMNETLETLHAAEGVRVVFLRGAGGVFSSGADLAWLREISELPESDNHARSMENARMMRRLWELPALTVALVEGAALGGGAGLVAACDMALAVRDARFGFSEVRLGLIPATISPYVVAAVGPREARRLFATGQDFSASEAFRLGLVHEVLDDAAGLDAAADRISRDMMASAPGAVAACKALVADVHGRRIDHGLMDDTARRMARARATNEGQEGVRALIDQARPSWMVE